MNPSYVALLLFFAPLYLLTAYYLVILFRAFRARERRGVSDSSNCSGCALEVVVPIKNEPIAVVKDTVLKNLQAFNSAGCLKRVVILSDDDPGYAEKLERGIGENGLVKVVRRDNPRGGRTGALDEIFASSSSDYILVLDVDGVVGSRALEGLCRELGEADAYIIPWRGYFYEKTRVAEAAAFSVNLGSSLLYRLRWLAGFYVFPLGSGTAYKRSAVLRVGGWGDNVIQDDIWMGVKLSTSGHRTALLEDGSIEVLVPSRLHTLRKQQSRWAYGTSEVLSKSLPRLLKASLPWSTRLEMIAYMMQPLQTLPAFMAFVLAPLIALIHTASDPVNIQIVNLLVLVAPLVALNAVYGYMMFRLAPEVYENGLKHYLVNLGRFTAILAVLSPHLSISALRGLLRAGFKWEVTPKGEKERALPKEKTPLLILAWSLLGATLSILTRNIYTLVISASYLVAAAYSLLRLEL
ncbi:glycosyltransferase family 2 protein [Infirmifilum lucidum]|uniref:Glycosyltransferase family 2 protein n=1 Tax=Infirmifilum lucidum TaxID=2776706 RepID=A0A7L9FIM0_9CREN|nr:glycosyltransferase family 2 protein [Infirmifilum lucidum]QOJ78625.1 glycosyltransferase family 2 protein [Infirmifilum lucidum]